MLVSDNHGRETFVECAGNPTDMPILLLHGIGADHQMFAPQLAALPGQGCYLIAPDLLGHGRSSNVPTLTLTDWEAQLNGLLDQLAIPRCTLVGVSMGGVIAQSLAIHHPDRVSQLILSDTFGELKTVRERMLGFSQVLGFRLYRLLGANMLARGMASAYKAPFAAQARTYFEQVTLDVDFDQLILARKAINQIDAIGKIDGRRIPTLVMVGDQFGESFVAINRKIANGIEGSRFVILPDAMDPSNLVNPVRFNQELLAFLHDDRPAL